MTKENKNIAASIRNRLLNISRTNGEDFNFILTRYALERLLYRIGESDYSNIFILKGALLLYVWTDEPYRPTRDADFLKYGNSSSESLLKTIKEICQKPVIDDGLIFDVENIRIDNIKEGQKYEGKRISLVSYLDKAKINVQIDVGFGDSVYPRPQIEDYPVLLDLPTPHLLMYPKETVIAEKLEAVVSNGIYNSRMKDFFDLWMMSKLFVYEEEEVINAIKATFERRQTVFPDSIPVGLSDEFFNNQDKQKQWNAFIKKNDIGISEENFRKIIHDIKGFYWPLLRSASIKK